MINALGGFITTAVDTIYYRVGEKLPEEPGLDTWFFDRSAVKSFEEIHCCLESSRSAEFAAARGSCGTCEVKA